jgi:hypothetical protein
MTTITDQRPASTGTATREEVMKFFAGGIPSVFLRGLAANPVIVAEQAAKSGAAEDEARDLMLSLADGVAALEAAERFTPDCPAVTDGGSHSIAWHQGGTCAFCGAGRDSRFTADITRFAQTPRTARRA